MYKIYILQKKLVQIDQSSPQQWSEYFTAAYMGLPPPTRWSTQRANGQYKDHLVGQLTTSIATCILMLYNCLWKMYSFFIFQWRKCADFLYFASRQYDWVAQTCKKNVCAKSTDRPKIRDVLGRLLQCHRVYVQWVYNMLLIDAARWH